ncbi:MAG: beta-galactosidase [Bacteroidetes bacterium]|nr:beta-galactosidase [Bacteroidota bacterium]MBU2583722.1 beta-galactosidase [Bacteroidota bacterium]
MKRTDIKSLNGNLPASYIPSKQAGWNYITDKKSKLTFEDVKKIIDRTDNKNFMDIPVNWQLAGLNNYSGSVWFYKTFDASNYAGDFFILEFNGVDYFTDVWLNYKFIGHHEGYFQKFIFDVTDKIKKDRENLLIVKVTSPLEEPKTLWPHKKKLIKGIFNHHDCRPGGWDYEHGQDMNTGGIWNNVNLFIAENLFITNLQIISKLNQNFSKARVKLTVEYLSKLETPRNENLQIKIISPSGKQMHLDKKVYLNTGDSSFEVTFDIDNPELWWTWDTGKPNLYRISLDGKIIPLTEESFGIREVKLDKHQTFFLNRKKMFLRGTNVIPTQFLSDLTNAKIAEQIKWIKEANINAIRVHAHVNRKEYYDECDKQGILVWQDFALQWTYDESEKFKRNAVSQIKDMVLLHFNHPSIAFWCCHNEPGNQIKTLDPFLFSAVRSLDNSRIIRIASNYEEHPYDGWYWGNKEHFAARPMGPLVTEFGAQALPELSSLKKILSKKEIEKPIWEKWKYHNFQFEQTFHIAGIDKGKSINEFIRNSQQYQAELIQTAIDFYRRGKHVNITGLFQFMFIDCWPSITWSVIDYYGKKKAGYFALKKAFQPVYVSIKIMRKKYFTGQKLNVDIWIINDLYKEYKNCKVEFVLNLKTFAKMKIPAIKEDSIQRFFWEQNEIYLPKKISTGVHNIIVLLKNQKGKVLSVNDFKIEIEKQPKL